MLCRNNLITVGKWPGYSLLLGIISIIFILGNISLLAHAYVSESSATNSYQSTEFKLDLNPISNLNKVNDITAPVDDLINSALNGLRFNPNINIGGVSPSPIKSPSLNMDFSKFFSSSEVSSKDITSFLSEAAITVINLSILIISITSQVLQGLLSVLK